MFGGLLCPPGFGKPVCIGLFLGNEEWFGEISYQDKCFVMGRLPQSAKKSLDGVILKCSLKGRRSFEKDVLRLRGWLRKYNDEKIERFQEMAMTFLSPEMTADDVLEFVRLLNQHGIAVILDGGWGVDALVGCQTRAHSDLDIAVAHADVPRIRALLEARGYMDVPRDDTRDCNFVMGDDQGHLIDFHSFTFDDQGNLTFGVPYPFESLQGTGRIGGEIVRCITPQWMLQFHTGYPLDENDYLDVKALCRHFGFAVPEEYADFVAKDANPLPASGG